MAISNVKNGESMYTKGALRMASIDDAMHVQCVLGAQIIIRQIEP